MTRVASETTAYITTVGEDHLIAVPESIPTGATVAVVFLPPTGGHAGPPELDETIRQAHFVAIMEALQAVADKPVPADAYTSAELDVLIEKARKATQS